MSDYCVKISVKSDYHALHNLSSNPTDKVSEFDNRDLAKIWPRADMGSPIFTYVLSLEVIWFVTLFKNFNVTVSTGSNLLIFAFFPLYIF